MVSCVHILALVITLLTSCQFDLGLGDADDSDEVESKNEEGEESFSQDEKLADIGKSEEEDLPDGFEVIDGIVMDISNVMVQIVTGNQTEYRFYRSKKTKGSKTNQAIYRRPKAEAGWHFIMFEDPVEIPGSGHMVLLQKLLGFSVRMGKENVFSQKEFRLYEAFHVDLGAEIGHGGIASFMQEDQAIGDSRLSGRNYVNKVGKFTSTMG